MTAFKLFLNDTGLLAAMGDIDVRTLLEANKIFQEFKGALTEQYVLQQLKTFPEMVINYWSAEKSTSEIDFLIQYRNKVIPVEVKAEENLQAKSLKVFYQKFSPESAIRTSMSDFRDDGWMKNLPLYAINAITDLIDG
jgi:predicted AAA+ superfamily ATPase